MTKFIKEHNNIRRDSLTAVGEHLKDMLSQRKMTPSKGESERPLRSSDRRTL